VNGIHEVTGSIPVWSTTRLGRFAPSLVASHGAPVSSALSERISRSESKGNLRLDST
jgi:hypothetical protein